MAVGHDYLWHCDGKPMTAPRFAFQDYKLILKDGKAGTEQACCCEQGCCCGFAQWFGRGSQAQRDRVRAHIEGCEGGVVYEDGELDFDGDCFDYGEGSYIPPNVFENDEIRQDGLIFNAARTEIVGLYGEFCNFLAQYHGQDPIDCNERCPCALPEEYDNSPCFSCPDDKMYVDYGVTERSDFTPGIREGCNPLP